MYYLVVTRSVCLFRSLNHSFIYLGFFSFNFEAIANARTTQVAIFLLFHTYWHTFWVSGEPLKEKKIRRSISYKNVTDNWLNFFIVCYHSYMEHKGSANIECIKVGVARRGHQVRSTPLVDVSHLASPVQLLQTLTYFLGMVSHMS